MPVEPAAAGNSGKQPAEPDSDPLVEGRAKNRPELPDPTQALDKTIRIRLAFLRKIRLDRFLQETQPADLVLQATASANMGQPADPLSFLKERSIRKPAADSDPVATLESQEADKIASD